MHIGQDKVVISYSNFLWMLTFSMIVKKEMREIFSKSWHVPILEKKISEQGFQYISMLHIEKVSRVVLFVQFCINASFGQIWLERKTIVQECKNMLWNALCHEKGVGIWTLLFSGTFILMFEWVINTHAWWYACGVDRKETGFLFQHDNWKLELKYAKFLVEVKNISTFFFSSRKLILLDISKIEKNIRWNTLRKWWKIMQKCLKF